MQFIFSGGVWFHAVFADAFYPDFQFVDSAGKRLFQIQGVHHQAFGIQTVDLLADPAEEMRMWRMVVAGGESIVMGPPPTELFDQSMLCQKL